MTSEKINNIFRNAFKKAFCFRKQNALGIHISNECINLALLKKDRNGISLLKTARGPVPFGAIEDGNIKDANLLAKAIKKLKVQNRIGSYPTAISLVANPVLIQILELPKNNLNNIREFISDEVKNYAELPTHNAAIDYCGIKNSDGTGERRALVIATDRRNITESAKALNQRGLRIDAIEPACIAYIRACFAKKIATKYDANLLFVVVHNDTVTLCLFRNYVLDFVRNKHIDTDLLKKDRFFEWLAKEIHAIIQFYEVEVSGRCEKWEVTVATETFDDTNNILSTSLNENVKHVMLDMYSYTDACHNKEFWLLEENEKISPVAIGLAMKLLDYSGPELNINLLPKEISEAKTTEIHTLITANAAAVILFIIILCAGFFSIKGKQVQKNMQSNKSSRLASVCKKLLEEQTSTKNEIKNITNRLKKTNQILQEHTFVQWDLVFSDIGNNTPKDVQITSLSSTDEKLVIEGRALSYEMIHLFVEMLDSSEHIKSAILSKTLDKNSQNDVVQFSVQCSLR
ncbi:MAG: PilN domain-containing protein [Planctomycetota bacterium]|jgi:Tfp pilus assembly protein PilN